MSTSPDQAPLPCPLCATHGAPAILRDGRTFHQCAACALIFVDPADHLTANAEAARYREHRNAGGDPEYLAFLRRLGDPVVARTTVGARGLDFGSGPVPALGEWLSATGRPTCPYDPLFAPDAGALSRTYDFVTCSEVVEHARDPAAMFAQLAGLVAPGGLLAVMTQFHHGAAAFATWWYRRDRTHVAFYDATTMAWIAGRYGWALELPGGGVALFRL